MFQLTDYDYDLPDDLIAQEAIHPHHDARLMVIDRETGAITDETRFWELDRCIPSDRIIFFNDSRVLRSRISLENIEIRSSQGEVSHIEDGEIFFLRMLDAHHFEALVRPGKRWKIGAHIQIGEYTLTVTDTTDDGRIIEIQGGSIEEFLEKHGQLPLPPYIEYSRDKESDYQTAFARHDGSVAAPTASLHFTPALLEKLPIPAEYLTLHVGLGTFKGIQTEDIRDYEIHGERVKISLDLFRRIAEIKQSDKKIIAVGTTACRTLESLPSVWKQLDIDVKNLFSANICNYWNTISGRIPQNAWIQDLYADTGHLGVNFETQIYITPGYEFLIVDDLITNFHLPKSSLIVLVSAFLGHDETMGAYEHAIREHYRFYSFGDGMYIRGKV